MGFQKLISRLAITEQTRECVINAGLFADCGSQALVGAGRRAMLICCRCSAGSDGVLWDFIIKGDDAPAILPLATKMGS